jgi:iron complex outermembrane receptor protein
MTKSSRRLTQPASKQFIEHGSLKPVAAAVVAALYGFNPALAQDDVPLEIEEIVVTATKRSLSMQDLGQSIAAFTTADIERQAFDSMEDTIKSFSSMTLHATMPGRNKIVFRGMATGAGEYRTDSAVAVYLDEQPMTAVSQQLDPRMVDIERVEALPGPQGTLFGASSQAGAFRIITNKPKADALTGQIDVNFATTQGGDPSYDISGNINIPLIEDKLAVRIVGYTVEEGGWVDNVLGLVPGNGQDGDNSDVVEENFNVWAVSGGRISVKWDMTDNWDVLLTGIAQQSETSGQWQTDPSLGDNKINAFNKEQRNDDWVSAGLTITGDLGFAEFTSASSFVDRDIMYSWDNLAYNHYITSAYYSGYKTTLYNVEYLNGTVFNDQIQKRFSQEFRLNSTGEGRFHWMIGAFYEDVDDDWHWGYQTPGLSDTYMHYYANYWAAYYAYYGYDVQSPLPETDNWWVQDYQRNVTQIAVFGEATIDLTDAWSMTFGARWFENERNRTEQNTFPDGLPPWGAMDSLGIDTVGGTQSDTTFKFGTQYNLNDDNMVYFIFSQGFRLGGDNSLRAASAGFVPRSYDSDTMDNYEIGNKSTWLNGRLQVNATLFHMKWDKPQLSHWNPDLWWQNGNLNTGAAEQTGIELNITAQLTDNFRLTTSITSMQGEFTEDLVLDGVVETPAGTEMPFSPDLKYWIGLDYTVPDAMLNGDLWFRYDISGQDAVYNSRGSARDGVEDIPAYNVSNFQIGWVNQTGLEISLRAKNVFDQRYFQSFSNGNNYIGLAFDDPRWRDMPTYNRPREISLGIRKAFY